MEKKTSNTNAPQKNQDINMSQKNKVVIKPKSERPILMATHL
ncbi:hypothetical protein [Xenorhabdus bovienii]|uniref:Uncharacterized protein n=1 Tax=Xenorhabdus bovienii str. feltiae Moldova TaxID=1398200 RepID=A0A077NML8_XENBV|nr:hypothetical protein [Xenorhabdus bovienii]CDG99573.1 hypothetical protein XBFM1_1060002 [Xenorhabdus bovienii str. feltiae Moldova]